MWDALTNNSDKKEYSYIVEILLPTYKISFIYFIIAYLLTYLLHK